jgi:hypothetical protein
MAELDQSDDLIGQEIHVGGKGAASAAAQAVPAQADVLTGDVVDDSQEPVGVSIGMGVHIDCPIGWVDHAPSFISGRQSLNNWPLVLCLL